MEKKNYSQITSRLSKIEGQLRGIKSMLESGREFTDVMTQLSAVKSGINNVVVELLFEQVKAEEHHAKSIKKTLSNFM